MPKLKWGGDLTPEAVEEATSSGGYNGDTAPPGLYRFKLRFAQSTRSSADNPMLTILYVLDGSAKKEHAKYDGCPMWDRITVIPSTAFKVKNFCDALNVKYKDFLTKVVVDDEGHIVKIGSLTIKDEDLLVWAKVGNEKYEGEDRLRLGRGGLLPFKEEDDDAASDDDDDDDDGDKDDDGDPF